MHPDLSGWSGRLSSLPDFAPPVAGWTGVLAARDGREGRHGFGLPAVFAAATLVTAAVLGWWLQPAGGPAPDAAIDDAGTSAAVAAGMRAENERLERILASLPERRAMRGSTAFTVAELEDRLALVDDRLSRVALEPNSPERVEELWRLRLGVMNSLVQVRYADAVGAY